MSCFYNLFLLALSYLMINTFDCYVFLYWKFYKVNLIKNKAENCMVTRKQNTSGKVEVFYKTDLCQTSSKALIIL